MHAVVLTFPGHFLQTALCIQSLYRWFPDVKLLTVIQDDIDRHGWCDYTEDFREYLAQLGISVSAYHVTSDVCWTKDCAVGWWRQQLIKLTLDQVVSGDSWFVIDGDTIFDSHCEIRDLVPVAINHRDPASMISGLQANYVNTLLGIDTGHITQNGQYAVTSSIPFRWLDRDWLQGLRQHVSHTVNAEFVQYHCQGFKDQTILVHDPSMQAMSMSEWELLEIYRREILGQKLQLSNIGSGYPIFRHTNAIACQRNIFRHGYCRDADLPRRWFQDQGLEVTDKLWHDITDWLITARQSGVGA